MNRRNLKGDEGNENGLIQRRGDYKKALVEDIKGTLIFLSTQKIVSDWLNHPYPDKYVEDGLEHSKGKDHQLFLMLKENAEVLMENYIVMRSLEPTDEELSSRVKEIMEEKIDAAFEFLTARFDLHLSCSIQPEKFVKMEYQEIDDLLDPVKEVREYHSDTVREYVNDVPASRLKMISRHLINGKMSVLVRNAPTPFIGGCIVAVLTLMEYRDYLKTILNKRLIKSEDDKFRPLEGTQHVWDTINKKINSKEYGWAKGEIFKSEVNWIEESGKYTLMLFIRDIEQYLYKPKTKGKWEYAFAIQCFTHRGIPIEPYQLYDTKKEDRMGRMNFYDKLKKLLEELNRKKADE